MANTYELTVHHLVSDFGIEPTTISPQATPAELDLDSLSLAELAVILQEQTGIRLEEVNAGTSLEEIARQIDAARADAATAAR
ncbi:phosphopantetheine-binding protein [Streptomyces phaeoluteigriseus]|uniref:Phosphopantetheine-binding protein n=1 Tax=Streptomyces phaeoluteigriseus TaxID=114686 RepID=A0ABY4Z9N5_9ACTN|nr:phosphopantetheine-binding protein [Streptomyces phaeoluteigriseus]USQ85660.1 phosphopantetheine-binding protein [Streptomyces phaeoluteigriseus]